MLDQAAQHNPPAAPASEFGARAVDAAAPPTPAMRQYLQQKQQIGDAILLFRMGDFYELFYDDAKTAAKLLGIALTSRDGGRTPLAGIPYHALDGYLRKLVEAGLKVAISEQAEDAAAAKGIVRREIVRIVTPGTLTDDALLARTRSNLLAAVLEGGEAAGIATLELASGHFLVQSCELARLIDELCRIAPAEILLPETHSAGRHPREAELRERTGAAITYRSASDFGAARCQQLLTQQFQTSTLAGFGFETVDVALQAAGALLAYVRETQRGQTQHISPPRRRDASAFVVLDPVTLRSLEIERTLRSGSRAGSLAAAVDRTLNPMGARLLRQWLCYPLREIAAIERRLTQIGALRDAAAARGRLRSALSQIGDIERIVGRIGVQRTHPRDLRNLGDGLSQLSVVRDALHETRCEALAGPADALEGLDDLAIRLCSALRPDAPLALKEGGIFAEGFHAELDRLRLIGRDGQRWLADYQAREIQRTGIPSLKVSYNRVFGYYIEITNAHRDRVPADYVRRQTVKNAERYITDELKLYEDEVLSAETRANALEYELFNELRALIAGHIPRLQQAAAALAEIDVLAGWAELSIERRYCRPEFVDAPLLEIHDGRHPVLEQVLDSGFVPNDAWLEAAAGPGSGIGDRGSGLRVQGSGFGVQEGAAEAVVDEGDPGSRGNERSAEHPAVRSGCLALITGPNMAGKSTYIRQVALLTLLAHCGSWVPASRMRLGVVDRIFTRVGASDELTRGQSTFMVEMLETANILHNASGRSLVILDEIGRGTSTYDGLALAWAISEYLAARIGCRALFATHYHELTELAELLEGVINLNVAVREYEDQIVFLHRIVAGAADRSYGLHVAKLAGVPRDVLERSNAVLSELERTFSRESRRPALAAVQRRRQRQLRLFEEPEEAIVRALRDVAPETLDAQRAMELIRTWRGLLG
jgi:DNA mismatch repair protein MutS